MLKRFTVVAVVLISLSCSTTEGNCCQGEITISFVSDTTWESFEMNPDGSMGPSLGLAQCVCACSSSPAGSTPFRYPYCWGADLSAIPGACWLWQPGVTGDTSPADLQGAYFSKSFDLPGIPTSGNILIAVDDFAEVQINGAIVGTTGSVTDYGLAAGAQGSLKPLDLTPFLAGGENTITVRAQNGPGSFGGCEPCSYAGNPAGAVFGGMLSFTAPTAGKQETWGSVKARFK